MTEIWPTVCGTGHRKMTQADARWLHDEILRILAKLEGDHGLTEVVSGMALGFDQQLAEMALVCNLRLHAVPPFPSQFAAWPEREQNHWHDLIMMATEITPASPRDPDFSNQRQIAAMLHGRNDTMLKMSQAVIAAADLTKLTWRNDRIVGGTWNCVDKAVKQSKPIIWMDPRARTVKKPTPEGWARIFREQKEKQNACR